MAGSKTFAGFFRSCGTALVVLVTLTFVCAIFGVVYYFTSPEGETVAVLPANGQNAANVAGEPGDTLHFVLSYEFPLHTFTVFGGSVRERSIARALRNSTLRVSARSPSGVVVDADCAPYNGRVGVKSDVMDTRSLSDALTDCVITLPEAGTYSVSGMVTWSPEIRATSEMLEVRRAPAAR